MKTVLINVTENDINRGDRGNSLSCPVAIAVHRKLTREVRVGRQGLFILKSFEPSKQVAPLPGKAVVFIKNFDEVTYGPKPIFKPFKFSVTVANKYVKEKAPSKN